MAHAGGRLKRLSGQTQMSRIACSQRGPAPATEQTSVAGINEHHAYDDAQDEEGKGQCERENEPVLAGHALS